MQPNDHVGTSPECATVVMNREERYTRQYCYSRKCNPANMLGQALNVLTVVMIRDKIVNLVSGSDENI